MATKKTSARRSSLVTTILREAGEPTTDEAIEATISNNLGVDWDAAQAGDPDALEEALIATLGPSSGRLISVGAVVANQLDGACTGIYWPDTNRTECRPHFDDYSWSDSGYADAGMAKLGVQLFGAVACDACAERDARRRAPGGRRPLVPQLSRPASPAATEEPHAEDTP
jgi:hypothetical protein